jgi:hypothetical protein
MKLFASLAFLLVSISLYSQSDQLTNKKLVQYFNDINKAENKITENDFQAAETFYRKAFASYKEPQAKDLYNSMQVSLKLKNNDEAFLRYQALKCLEYQFEPQFYDENFSFYKAETPIKCNVKLDYGYKNTLDSLFTIDQYYRKLSGGDNVKYQKEITKSDSLISTKLLKLIRQKGFPNEYNIGLVSNDKSFFHQFYLIISHQLVKNTIGPQRINFSKEIIKGLNKGKIAPDYAAFLLDVNTGTNSYSSSYFEINQFITEKTEDKSFDQIEKSLQHADCCYIHEWFLPEKRDKKAKKMVAEINGRRTKIGMSILDDHLKKKIYSLSNKDFELAEAGVTEHHLKDPSEVEMLKKNLIKIK